MTRIARSLLFVPGNRPERFAKAAASGAHEVVIDLEDAVAPDDKSLARDAVMEWLSTARGNVMVRVNGADTPWFVKDLEMMSTLPDVPIMLPKADRENVQELVLNLEGRSIVALIETTRGVKELPQIAAVSEVNRLAFGSVDFSVETGISDTGEAMTSIRNQFVLESCYAGLIPPVDGVDLEIEDAGGMRDASLRSKTLGFGGKLCIHPRQVAAVNAAFLPSDTEIDWAERVIAAMEKSQGGATSVDGKMVDKPVVVKAERILAESRP